VYYFRFSSDEPFLPILPLNTTAY